MSELDVFFLLFQFYEAVIEVMAANMPTVVVTFIEYGNTEEVLLTDIRPCNTIQLVRVHQSCRALRYVKARLYRMSPFI